MLEEDKVGGEEEGEGGPREGCQGKGAKGARGETKTRRLPRRHALLTTVRRPLQSHAHAEEQERCRPCGFCPPEP